MANYKWVNGQLVDTELGAGLGSFKVGNSDSVSSNTTLATPNKFTGAYFGATGDNGSIVDLTDYTKSSSNNMFGDLFGSEGFGMNKGTMQGLGSISDIGAGLGKLFLGAKQLGLAEDKFAFDKDMLNKQYAMAKDAYDKQTARSASIGSQMAAGRVG
jgi:hypothetical protein